MCRQSIGPWDPSINIPMPKLVDASLRRRHVHRGVKDHIAEKSPPPSRLSLYPYLFTRFDANTGNL
eukprot:7881227-Pyramimonas_sp.AAC.1